MVNIIRACDFSVSSYWIGFIFILFALKNTPFIVRIFSPAVPRGYDVYQPKNEAATMQSLAITHSLQKYLIILRALILTPLQYN